MSIARVVLSYRKGLSREEVGDRKAGPAGAGPTRRATQPTAAVVWPLKARRSRWTDDRARERWEWGQRGACWSSSTPVLGEMWGRRRQGRCVGVVLHLCEILLVGARTRPSF
jgi:hypothetical protein